MKREDLKMKREDLRDIVAKSCDRIVSNPSSGGAAFLEIMKAVDKYAADRDRIISVNPLSDVLLRDFISWDEATQEVKDKFCIEYVGGRRDLLPKLTAIFNEEKPNMQIRLEIGGFQEALLVEILKGKKRKVS